ncbi:PepSY domain-containing protein [Paludisphaera rhizosphaerae]|uniref:PepSY domain-containing protein n=1 Tax=Paludisphaera rhizosphaerae TaxID=2711216 RepID=UPI0013EAB713|nr:PepSY domain-containing protein [Paludisphaera rhizosphaerae]
MDQAYREVAEPSVDEASEVIEVEGVGEEESPRKVSPALAMARAAAERAAQAEAAAPEAKSRAWGRDALMVVRRSHLYAGLLLYPWVLLYGVTAFLFNHPGAFSDQTMIQFGRDQMKGTALEKLPAPVELASKVVAALNAKKEGASYRLLKPEAARFERGGVSASVKGADGKFYTVSIDGDGNGGMIRLTPAGAAVEGGMGGPEAKGARRGGGRGGEGGFEGRGEGGMGRGRGEAGAEGRGGEGGTGRGRGEGGAEGRGRGEGGRGGEGGFGGRGRGEGGPGGRGAEGPPAPFATTGLSIDGLPLEEIREALPTVLARVGLTGATVADLRVAPLSFQMEAEGRPWLANWSQETGAVAGRSIDDPASQAELTTRRFLLRLHTIHGYPSEFGQRWIWALIVDCMAFLMVFWGLSGIIMWWQIKRTRRIGAIALSLSTAAAVWIGVGMHGYFVNGGR